MNTKQFLFFISCSFISLHAHELVITAEVEGYDAANVWTTVTINHDLTPKYVADLLSLFPFWRNTYDSTPVIKRWVLSALAPTACFNFPRKKTQSVHLDIQTRNKPLDVVKIPEGQYQGLLALLHGTKEERPHHVHFYIHPTAEGWDADVSYPSLHE